LGEIARPPEERTPEFRLQVMGTSRAAKSKGGREGREAFSLVRWRESPRDPKAQESKSALSQANHLGSNKGYGWLGEIKSLRRR
jgi:hypothetical protein